MSVEPTSEFYRVVCVPADALATLCDAYVALTGGSTTRPALVGDDGREDEVVRRLERSGISFAAADDAYDVLTAHLPTEGE